MSSAAPSPSTVIHQLKKVVENPELYRSHQQEITSLAYRVESELQTPFELFQGIVHTAMPLVAVRVCQQHRILHMMQENVEKGQLATSTASLAQDTGMNRQGLETLLEFMAARHFVDRVSSNEFASNRLTRLLLTPLFMEGVLIYHDFFTPSFTALNAFLSSPRQRPTAFQLAHNTSDGPYDMQHADPDISKAFQNYIQLEHSYLPSWLNVVDFQSEFAEDTSTDTVLFVDVGCGNGQQCVNLLTENPNLRGRVILQDTPSVIQNALPDSRVETMGYDYFTEQPVKGAKAYHFRQIFHNNDDDECFRILEALLPAMSSSSTLLINENVLPDDEPSTEYRASLSMTMMALFNTYERREGHWHRLLDKAGLTIKAIRRFSRHGDSILMAVKK
ncbi:S-adenosyl-L-methionine-dependent methyltransferase [Aspergillus pseudonomiae]|uniref:S-adenosyl-L-methionine-dependent methyltransferase n=1 Tax=Aspergillus pseudonomiae TaxID=1506151 RepID=A0A5N7DAC2_9EURO|nr:S-adenosyl-L-methionine-dependent methyltransferase [Aspergillus pseudonomiae]KAE8403184.1 S-adenosyl-L-methionine-dependent methyltransferase [Aspergillus pseudonomiae]